MATVGHDIRGQVLINYLEEAYKYMRKKQWVQDIDPLTIGIEEGNLNGEDLSRLYNTRGACLFHLGKYTSALEDFDRALASNNSTFNITIYQNRAKVWIAQKNMDLQ